MNIKKPISLNELARLLKVSKSKLAYYKSQKLIAPITSVGRMHIFEKDDVIKTIHEIEKKKKMGIKLKEFAKQKK